MTDAEKKLHLYCNRIFTENTLTSVQAAGLESIAKDAHGTIDWQTVSAVLMDIQNRYTKLERDLQTAAGMTADQMEITD